MDYSDSEEVSEVPMAELILTADGLRLFRIRRTVMEMLRDRGYEVPDAEFRRSPEQFRTTFGTAPNRHTLNFCTSKCSNPDDRVRTSLHLLYISAEICDHYTFYYVIEFSSSCSELVLEFNFT